MSHLLLVEDDLGLLEIIQEEICRCFSGMIVTSATSGFEAIEMLSKNKNFDAIVCDYKMNNGSGIDVLQYLVFNRYRIPFLLHTSELSPWLPVQLGDSFVGVIAKMDFDTLNLELAKILV